MEVQQNEETNTQYPAVLRDAGGTSAHGGTGGRTGCVGWKHESAFRQRK